MGDFNLRHFLVENKLTQNAKIISEGLESEPGMIPFYGLRFGMTGKDPKTGKEYFIIHIFNNGKDQKVFVRDFETSENLILTYGKDVVAYFSDQSDEEDEEDLDEASLYDADDFIPFDQVEPGMIATDEDGEKFKVIEKLDGEQVRCSLVDDPRDIETVKYGNIVMCHYSDQQDLDDDNEF